MKISPLPSSRLALLYKCVKLSSDSQTFSSKNITIESDCSTTCSYHTIVLDEGSYKFELWGSQGENSYHAGFPGNGSYVSGIFTATKNTTIYAFVGNKNGFNGGGSGGYAPNLGGKGGGATDIRIGGTGVDHRIMVAGGGGGGGGNSNNIFNNRDYLRGHSGGNGGYDGEACNPASGSYGKKGEQARGGSGGGGGISTGYIFNTARGNRYCSGGGGGGGGYFGGGGGGSGAVNDDSYNRNGNPGYLGNKGGGGNGGAGAYSSTIYAHNTFHGCGGGGGSSFINETLVEKLEMLNGSSVFENVLGETQKGNQRNGAIRITQISNLNKRTSNSNIVFSMQRLIKSYPGFQLFIK